MPDRSWALQRKLMRAPNIGFNAEVYRYFRDVDDSTPGKLALRNSLLIQANDSRTSAKFKVDYFREFVQKVHSRVAIIGVPKQMFDDGFEPAYKPIVTLYFQQDRDAVTPGFAPITAEISFRLMQETQDSLTKPKKEVLAKTLKNELALRQGYTFNKGKYIAHYQDRSKGYHLQIYVASRAEGEQVVKKILSLQDHTYNNKKFRLTDPDRDSVNNPGKIVVAGETYTEPRWRPTGTVRFQWAYLLFQANPDPVYLVDRTLTRPSPIELVY